jgi:hypothetical protein
MAVALPIAITSAREELAFLPALANRHGLITGATGTGKTITMQVMAEAFSRVDGDRWFHAASTIKVAILVAVSAAIDDDHFQLVSRLAVRNRFISASWTARWAAGNVAAVDAPDRATHCRALPLPDCPRRRFAHVPPDRRCASGRALSLLDLPARPPAYEDVGRLCTWQHEFVTTVARSRYERVLIQALSGAPLRVGRHVLTPIGTRGWSRVVFRREGDGVRETWSIDALLPYLDGWERTL